ADAEALVRHGQIEPSQPVEAARLPHGSPMRLDEGKALFQRTVPLLCLAQRDGDAIRHLVPPLCRNPPCPLYGLIAFERGAITLPGIASVGLGQCWGSRFDPARRCQHEQHHGSHTSSPRSRVHSFLLSFPPPPPAPPPKTGEG